MRPDRWLFCSLIMTALITLIGSPALAQTGGEIRDHPHKFPYTKVLGEDYHLRLIVDHSESELWLVFEDISEKALQLMPLKTIAAEVIFPGGARRDIEFKALEEEREWTHGDAHPVLRLQKRMAGKYVYRDDWVKERGDFDLIVKFPFQEKDYKFVFDYSTGGHMFPYHMGR